MDKDLLKGIKIGSGFLLIILSFFGLIFAVGFHNTNEIVSGTFIGNYFFQDNVTFQNEVNFTNTNVVGLNTIPTCLENQTMVINGSGTNSAIICLYPLGGYNNPATSCEEILNDSNSNENGNYWIKPSSIKNETYCDMSTDGGGWSMIYGYNSNRLPIGDVWVNYNNLEVYINSSARNNPSSLCLFGKWTLDNNAEIISKTNFGGGSTSLPEEVGDPFNISIVTFFNNPSTGEYISLTDYFSICGASGWESIGTGFLELYVR